MNSALIQKIEKFSHIDTNFVPIKHKTNTVTTPESGAPKHICWKRSRGAQYKVAVKFKSNGDILLKLT